MDAEEADLERRCLAEEEKSNFESLFRKGDSFKLSWKVTIVSLKVL
jgi:hypothetical protein